MCSPCGVNFYAPRGSATCYHCPAGTSTFFSRDTQFSSAKSAQEYCRPCEPGQCSTGEDDKQTRGRCFDAPRGYYSAGAQQCQEIVSRVLSNTLFINSSAIDTGRRRAQLTSQPFDVRQIFVPCPPGTFSDSLGATACKLCPPGTVNPLPAAEALEMCIPCAAFNPASASSTEGAATFDACVPCSAAAPMQYSNSTHCLPCPAGQWCDGTAFAPVCMSDPAHCLGEGGCAAGYSGYRCQSCAPGYFLEGASLSGAPASDFIDARVLCSPCPSVARWFSVVGAFLVALVVLVALALAVAYVPSLQCAAGLWLLHVPRIVLHRLHLRMHHVHHKHSTLCGILGLHLKRLVVLFSASALLLPTDFRAWLEWSALLTLASPDVVQPSCFVPWSPDTTWITVACIGLGAAVTLLLLDWFRVEQPRAPAAQALAVHQDCAPAERGDAVFAVPESEAASSSSGARCSAGASAPPPPVSHFRDFFLRLFTNNAADYHTTLWSESFLNWSAGVFVPLALRAVACSTGSDGRYTNIYDPGAGDCVAGPHGPIFVLSTIFLALYAVYLVHFFVVPLWASTQACGGGACRRRLLWHRPGAEETQAGRHVLAWRLVKHAVPTLSSTLVLAPRSAGLAVLWALFACELAAAALTRGFVQAHGRRGRVLYGCYLAASFITLVALACVVGGAAAGSSELSALLIAVNFFGVPLALVLALAPLLCFDHTDAPYSDIVYIEPYAVPLTASMHAGQRGCGGKVATNAWLCLQCKVSAAEPLQYRHLAINSDYRSTCWQCSLPRNPGSAAGERLWLAVAHPDFDDFRAWREEERSVCMCKPAHHSLQKLAEVIEDEVGRRNNLMFLRSGGAHTAVPGLLEKVPAELRSALALAAGRLQTLNLSPYHIADSNSLVPAPALVFFSGCSTAAGMWAYGHL